MEKRNIGQKVDLANLFVEPKASRYLLHLCSLNKPVKSISKLIAFVLVDKWKFFEPLFGKVIFKYLDGKWFTLPLIQQKQKLKLEVHKKNLPRQQFIEHILCVNHVLTQNVHLAPNTQQAEQAGFTRAKNHKTCQSIFPEN
jgi:hypothetical protein